MMQLPYLDPLEAAQLLLDYILDAENGAGTIEELASHIDAFMYALRYLRTNQVRSIQETDVDSPANPKGSWRRSIATRFPMLGLYWNVTPHRTAGQNPEILVDDAIDDLDDIAREISRAMWYLTNYGRDEALAALRFGYEHHLHMHLVPLRLNLETEIFEYW
jgi:hypothetical protein